MSWLARITLVAAAVGVAKLVGCSSFRGDALDVTGPPDASEEGGSPSGDAGDAPDAIEEPAPVLAARAVELAVGRDFTCARLTDGRVKCWGNNASGQLGLGDEKNRGDEPGEMGASLPAVDLGAHQAKRIVAGAAFACAILDDGSVKCWGDNAVGQLGIGTTDNRGNSPGELGDALPSVHLGGVQDGGTAKHIAAGTFHACAVRDDGRVVCWGFNAWGQLGAGDAVTHTNPADPVDLGPDSGVRAVAASYSSTCALLVGERVKCWGWNHLGQLGAPAQPDAAAPEYGRGDAPGELGAALPTVDLGDAGKVEDLVMGCFHACAALDGNRLKCWGYNALGALGLGDTRTRDGSDAGPMGNALPAVNLGAVGPIRGVSAGCYHTCATTDAGVKCWGYNDTGQLGLGDRVTRGTTAATMGDALPFVALGDTPVTAAANRGIDAVQAHTCAIFGNGRVKCWGANSFGQLGLGNRQPQGDDPMEMGDALPFVDLGLQP